MRVVAKPEKGKVSRSAKIVRLAHFFGMRKKLFSVLLLYHFSN